MCAHMSARVSLRAHFPNSDFLLAATSYGIWGGFIICVLGVPHTLPSPSSGRRQFFCPSTGDKALVGERWWQNHFLCDQRHLPRRCSNLVSKGPGQTFSVSQR